MDQSTTNSMTDIIAVDNHTDFLSQLCAAVQAAGKLRLLATARDLKTVMWLLKSLQPDCLLLDPSLPDSRGTNAIQLIHASYPGMALIALSMHADGRYAAGALTAGCRGYLLKDCIHAELQEALCTVQSGRIYVSRQVGFVGRKTGRDMEEPGRNTRSHPPVETK